MDYIGKGDFITIVKHKFKVQINAFIFNKVFGSGESLFTLSHNLYFFHYKFEKRAVTFAII